MLQAWSRADIHALWAEEGSEVEFEGQLNVSIPHGLGVARGRRCDLLHCTFSGTWDNGKRDGYGVECVQDKQGQICEHYAGQMKRDARHGCGVLSDDR